MDLTWTTNEVQMEGKRIVYLESLYIKEVSLRKIILMKQFLAAFLFFAFALPIAAQQKTFFDSEWHTTKRKYAVYYRTVQKIKNAAGDKAYFISNYYNTDSLYSTGTYLDKAAMVKNGLYTMYNYNGKKSSEAFYVNNEINGFYREYYPSGQLSGEINYIKGIPEGESFIYYETGKLNAKSTFSNGELAGKFLQYYPGGELSCQKTYVNGKEEDSAFFYFESGRIRERAFYRNGQMEGKAFAYFESGHLSDDLNFVNGKLDGECRWHFENGQVSSIEQYGGGSLLQFELFLENGERDLASKVTGYEAEYPGGLSEMRKYISQSIHYPDDAIELGIEGKVSLQFQIDTNGKVGNIKIVKSVDPLLDNEAVRIVQSMPNWKPGKDHGRILPTFFNLPITFSL